ncbi:uncharacterized protein N7515_010178 [Penicillium bovifimosum]|uniref:Uncharacterized protein n=1 Tax=Penicillium bovifimosum TaxID=126998 RepID=A0A9W9GIC6_9EURO|nr:uncharacterized protein N7515_010178 [Penicillium bovifimosum]KAJ5120790.1 hypothetical protein N7515_010178 [Penicillium bovifimosum]
MSQSQEFGSSQLNLFDSEPDDLSFTTSSICPATPSTSRQVDSVLSRQVDNFPRRLFLRLSPPDPLERFQRVGPGRGQYFLYDTMLHNDWSKINWDSQHSRAKIWKEFDQVAHSVHGTAKVMCKNCSTILEHPYATRKERAGQGESSRKDSRHGTTTMIRHVNTSSCQRAASGRRQRDRMMRFLQTGDTTKAPFSQEAWDNEILRFITINRLPFNLVENPTFRRLISRAQSAPSPSNIPSADTVRRRLSARVKDRQQDTLRMLPEHAKMSVALDCWTSPFGHAFMAITGHFIDADWVYREVLLGFKPLHGTHSGTNLSSVLMKTLTEYGIKHRVFGLTTDNASNNKTLIDTLQQSLPNDINIIRIPCLAHVIQLSLNQLLDRLKAVPLNDATEIWTDSQFTLVKVNATSKKQDISHTLKKVRYLALYIRGSSQRRDSFIAIQPPGQGLMPIQDVRTRWNSTFLMLRRAKRLRVFIMKYCDQFNCKDFALDDDQWRQIDYLLYLTKPFFDFTLALSKSREVTSHLVFLIYNRLFEHLEKSITQLRRKRVLWKQQMLSSLEASHAKLRDYYKETDKMRGHIYAVCTMLSPDSRFQFFLSDDWADAKELRDQYRVAFRDALTPIQERLTRAQGPQGPSSGSAPRSLLRKLARNVIERRQKIEISRFRNELASLVITPSLIPSVSMKDDGTITMTHFLLPVNTI